MARGYRPINEALHLWMVVAVPEGKGKDSQFIRTFSNEAKTVEYVGNPTADSRADVGDIMIEKVMKINASGSVTQYDVVFEGKLKLQAVPSTRQGE